MREQFESTLRKRDALDSALEAGKSFFLAGLVLDSAKEISKRLMHSVRDILLDLRMHIRRISLDYGVIIKLCQRNTTKFVGILRNGKKIVISRFANLQLINNSNFLFRSRIDSVFEHLLNDHIVWMYQPIYKPFGGNEAIHPTAKAVGFLA